MNVNRFSGLFILFILSVFIAQGPASGGEISIGRIDKVEGPSTVLRSDGHEVTGREGLPIFPGDQLSTGKGGMIWFSLQQGQQFRLGEDAQMSVDELSALEVEDSQFILRLVLGYLWSKIKKVTEKAGRLEVHTPTVVIGVLGTEFDTVVSLDATSMIALDDGSIEINAEGEKIILDEGSMSQVELDVKPAPPISAIPKEKRDWQAWRRERTKMLFKSLPHKAPRFRVRFERAVDKFTGLTIRIKEASARLSAAIEGVGQAKTERDRQKFVQSVRQVRAQVPGFKRMVARFRRALSRVRVVGKISYRIQGFVANNKEHFSSQELAGIESNLAAISQKRMQLIDISRGTVLEIRKTFNQLRGLREETGKAKGWEERDIGQEEILSCLSWTKVQSL